MATRTFARQFRAETSMTPMRWLNTQRVQETERLLEATDLTIDEVARRCGLGTAVNLRTHLARHLRIHADGLPHRVPPRNVHPR